MTIEHTQQQSTDEQARAKALSLRRAQPPAQIAGYDARRFLGSGAYGEVWVAIDRNTGRQVAIKFYAHRGGLDWSLLSREVEKLAFLSADRYVVQLLDVGWDADPPYYVMEYVEQGSLSDLLFREKTLPPRQAVELFREIAVGLLHAHAKGVLHCDLKPANVLIDQDAKPRLADFGQSRLSNDQTPALGTLFYMAPEQADLRAAPDVQWDVYALGSLLYCMLTGAPPYRTDGAVTEMETAGELDERLARYRRLIETSPRPTAHRQMPGVDRSLADIVDGCLAVDRQQRFANVQEVLDALEARERRRARRSLVVLAAVGPALVMAVMALCAWWWFETVLRDSDQALRERAWDRNSSAAQADAKTVTNELDRRFQAVEEMSSSHRFQQLLKKTLDDLDLTKLRDALNAPGLGEMERERLRQDFLANPARLELQQRLDDLLNETSALAVSWFVLDPSGLQLARAPDSETVGLNFAWRTYFTGQVDDEPATWRPAPGVHIKDKNTNLSSVFRSQATNRWSAAISAPVEIDEPEPKFLGVVALTDEVRHFGRFQDAGQNKPFAVLVDGRPGKNKGLILQHPLFNRLVKEQGKVPDRLMEYRVRSDQLPDKKEQREDYIDPLSADPEGKDFDTHWLAARESVGLRDGATGWVVIEQESYDDAIGKTLARLKSSLLYFSVLAGAGIALLSTLWGFVIRAIGESSRRTTPIVRATMPTGD